MGYNFSARVIIDTPDATYYSSDVFIARKRFVWVHGLEKFLPIQDVSMYVHCILVKNDDQFLIFNNFGECLAKSKTEVNVDDSGFIILQDPSKHVLASVDGKNLYERSFWSLLPYMGGKIEIPSSLVTERRFVKTKSGKDIAELTRGFHVEIYEEGILIKNPRGKYSYVSTKHANGELIVSNAHAISVSANELCVKQTKRGPFYFIKDP